METSFFSGSENLYKYLVTIGLLLMVLTVYYPLKEKRELEIETIKIENDLNTLNYKIKENLKNVENLRNSINKNGNTDEARSLLITLDKLNQENNIGQLENETKFSEIKCRRQYIALYKWMFWIFFPVGLAVCIFGFIRWKSAKKYDDNILKLENEKLGLEVAKLKRESKIE